MTPTTKQHAAVSAQNTFLAVIFFSDGGGSWARDEDKAKAIARCKRFAEQDYKAKGEGRINVFELKPGQEAIIREFEVFDEVTREDLPLLERVTVTLKGRA
jgi:hypothetical protein